MKRFAVWLFLLTHRQELQRAVLRLQMYDEKFTVVRKG